MEFLLRPIVNFVSGCLSVWAAVYFFGATSVSLVMAVLAIGLASMSLHSAHRHAEELQRLREQVSTNERNLNRSHDELSDLIESLDRRLHKAIARTDAMTLPRFVDSD